MNETPETTEKISQSCNYRKHMIFPSLHPQELIQKKKLILVALKAPKLNEHETCA